MSDTPGSVSIDLDGPWPLAKFDSYSRLAGGWDRNSNELLRCIVEEFVFLLRHSSLDASYLGDILDSKREGARLLGREHWRLVLFEELYRLRRAFITYCKLQAIP